jgi:hypothetical protein
VASRHRLSRRARFIGTICVLVSLVLLSVATVVDLRTRDSLHQAERQLAQTRTQLRQTGSQLVATRSSLATATTTGQTLATAVGSTNQELEVNNQSLTEENNSLFIANLDLTALHTCLSGVATAYQGLASSNLPGAVSAITAASSSCLSVEGGGNSGLSYPYDFPDPSVLNVNNTYYAYATNSAAGNIQIITSTDLTHWTAVGDALPHPPSWADPGTIWAPSVVQLGGNYVLYYTAGYALTGKQCISVAVAGSPEGPFVDNSQAPLVCQLTLGGSIDPSAFVDPSGNVYLDWKSVGAGGQPATLWAQQLSPDGSSLVGNPSMLLQPSQSWEDGVVEAPDMFWLNGERYLFYAGANWNADSYAIGAAGCSGPLGPCTRVSGQPIFSSQADIVGPGGPTAFWNSAGTAEIAFAAWLPGAIGFPNSRVLFIRPLKVVNGVPTICAPPGAAANQANPAPC